jgi:hypothetical protein
MNEYLANATCEAEKKTNRVFVQEIRANIATWSKARLNSHIDLLLTAMFTADAQGDLRSSRELRIEAMICALVWLRRLG